MLWTVIDKDWQKPVANKDWQKPVANKDWQKPVNKGSHGLLLAHLAFVSFIINVSMYIPYKLELEQSILLSLVSITLLFALLFLPLSKLKYLLFTILLIAFGKSLQPLGLEEFFQYTFGILFIVTLLGFADQEASFGLGPYIIAGLSGIVLTYIVKKSTSKNQSQVRNSELKTSPNPLMFISLTCFTVIIAFISQRKLAGSDLINESLEIFKTNRD